MKVVAAAFAALFSRADSDVSLIPSSDVIGTAWSDVTPTTSVLVDVVPFLKGVMWTIMEAVTVTTFGGGVANSVGVEVTVDT